MMNGSIIEAMARSVANSMANLRDGIEGQMGARRFHGEIAIVRQIATEVNMWPRVEARAKELCVDMPERRTFIGIG